MSPSPARGGLVQSGLDQQSGNSDKRQMGRPTQWATEFLVVAHLMLE